MGKRTVQAAGSHGKTGRWEKKGKEEGFLEPAWEQMTEIYLWIMLAVYPLFMGRGYEELVYKKWMLFLYASLAFVLVSLVCGTAIFFRNRQSAKKQGMAGRQAENGKSAGILGGFGSGTDRWMAADWFAAVYLIAVLVSYVGAIDRKAAFWGVDTWYMGLVSQVLFIGIYFGVSRGYSGLKYLRVLAASVWGIVGGIVVLQRFGLDVAHLYQGFGEEVKLDFVTTLGQVTWSSSYLSILLAAGMGIYFLTETKRWKVFWGCCMGLGFAVEMLLNSDSGIIAVFAAFMVMLWLAVGNGKRLLALTETVMAALLAAAVVGILERIFGERMVPIDAVYLKAAQSGAVYVLLAAVVVFYLAVRKVWVHKDGAVREAAGKKAVKIIRGIYVACVCLGIAGVAVLFFLHGKGYFAGSPTENYFRFTIWWGNSRGFIWRTGAAVFADFNLWRKLFGCGPDCFTPYAYRLMGDAINGFWHNQLVPNVHNEWFNGLINYGIVGGTAYLGIFVSAAYGLMKTAWERESAVVFGIGLASAAYIAHNVLCYQQVIGTPLMFLLLGIGVAKVRKESWE